MSFQENMMDAVIDLLLETGTPNDARVALSIIVHHKMIEFPQMLLRDSDLEEVRVRPFQAKVRLFPLGDFRDIRIGSITGKTTLYIGNDGRLYEHGPLNRRQSAALPLANDRLALRYVGLQDMGYTDLMVCSDLLSRVWLV